MTLKNPSKTVWALTALVIAQKIVHAQTAPLGATETRPFQVGYLKASNAEAFDHFGLRAAMSSEVP